ncbi:MAG TPA: hypothetical protein EYQ79_06085 [Flavobacteriaceae bacterium]|nr:hypothetical protein [Flavobacteriaceae bacterium]
MKNSFCLFFVLIFSFTFSQDRKILNINRFDSPPKIDGILNDANWKTLIPATKFERWMPNNGSSEKDGYEHFVYIGYDDNAIYVAGKFNNPNPIPVEFSQRDDIWEINAETFFISINSYDDNINEQSFQVTSAGTLGDSYTSGEMSDEDWDFDTVFESKVSIGNKSWSMEMRIPYSALRFPSKKIQKWGINFGRKIAESGEVYTWNFVDQKNANYGESMGITSEIKDISPPIRLFFYPYAQSSIDFKKGSSPLNGYSAGMDLKYGINNSFTLDATLIPDFGQVTFDDKELNLSPFEQQFDENRAFFTEGSSLFKKADRISFRGGSFFYSRRIGDEISFDEEDILNANEKILSYDRKADLLNSIKLTGTTSSGLSIGFINSITDNAYASIENSLTGKIRKEKIAPATNFNVLSLNQQVLNEYSTISFLNANVYRIGEGFDNSNNSAFVFNLFDDKRKFNIKGNVNQSNSPVFSETKGFRGALAFDKLTGSLRYGFGWRGVDANYYQNDLGYYNNRNDQSIYAKVSYMTFNPTDLYEKLQAYLYVFESSRFYPKIKKSSGWRLGGEIISPKLEEIKLVIDYDSKNKNFEEPRSKNSFINEPAKYEFQLQYKSDTRKKIQYSLGMEHSYAVEELFDEKKNDIEINSGIGFRLSNNFNLDYEIKNEINYDDVGYVYKENENIYFGKRDVKALENNLILNYNFDSYKSLNLRFRQFWSSAKYDDSFFLLNSKGERVVSDKSIIDNDPNTNFNLWNLDLSYNWEFLPGSKLTLLYRNNIFNENNLSGISYYSSTKELFQKPIDHQVSIRINYFLDYNLIKRKKKRI